LCSFFCYTVAIRDFLCKVYDKLYYFLGYADMRLILGYESGGKGCARISFDIRGLRPLFLSRTVERAYSSNRYTQCKNCWGFGHVAPRCPSVDPTCPISSLNHTRAMHRCPNLTCPGGGNLKATPGCCYSSPPRCANCEGAHTATHRDCVSRPAPPTLRRSTAAATIVLPPPAGDAMDTAADEDDLSPPASPTRSLQSVFQMATPRARSSTILPASVGPAQGNRSLPPVEPVSPSPMSRTPSGLAR